MTGIFTQIGWKLKVIPIFCIKVCLRMSIMSIFLLRKIGVPLPVTLRRRHVSLIKRIILIICVIIGFFLLYRLFDKVKSIQNVEERFSARFRDLNIVGSRFNGRLDEIRGHSYYRNFEKMRKDWHDYEYIEKERQRVGLGENGTAVSDSEFDQAEVKRQLGLGGFNAVVSDHIALNRSVPDIRHPDCHLKHYLIDLPTVSIVIPFHNEYWSTLLRTCYSILIRSPEHLIVEIILVDDGSEWEYLKGKLDAYVAEHLPKVKIIRLPKRMGLIKARAEGALIATADILLFLDAHCEPNVNWLPPLLEPIAENYRVVMCPFIDVISYETFKYVAQDDGKRGGFDWQLYYKRLDLLKEDQENPSRPFKSPVMAGGLFAISTKFFRELGGYDEGIIIWGGEQYELSFKIWQCGGEMYDAPCSRVGHVYRGPSDPKPPAVKGDFLHKNYMRVAEVWMDEYKHYVYQRNAEAYAKIDPGDLTLQKAIRDKLECKSFKWFMENIAFDIPKKYPPIEPPDYAWGAIQSIHHPDLCIDLLNLSNDQKIGLWTCTENKTHPYTNQMFAFTAYQDFRNGDRNLCWDLSHASDKSSIHMRSCHRSFGNQLWRYDHHKKWITHGEQEMWCVGLDANEKTVFITNCADSDQNILWEFGVVNRTALDNIDTVPLF